MQILLLLLWLVQVRHKERELEELRRVVDRSTSQHPDAAATRAHLTQQLRAKDDQIKVRQLASYIIILEP